MPFAQERHGFQHPPKLFLLGDEENAANPLGKTGGYNPDNMEVTIYVSGRHPKDILRSLSHELVHHNQNERGDFSDMVSTALGYAQEDPHMRNMEGEAYREGNLCFRDWEDGRKKQLQESIYYETVITEEGGEDMSNRTPLKEWKDNEINSRLMKKFGLVKEAESGEADSITIVDETTAEKRTGDEEDEEDDEDGESTNGLEEKSVNDTLSRLSEEIVHLLEEQASNTGLSEKELADKYAELPAGATWTAHEPDYVGLSPAEMKETEGFYKPWFVQDESEWKPPGLYSLSAKQQREDPVHVEPPSARDKYTDWLHKHQLGPQHATEAGLPWYHWKQFVPTMQQDPKHLGYQESSPGYFGQYTDDWRGDIPIDVTPYTIIDAVGIGGGLKAVGKGLSKLLKPDWKKIAGQLGEEATEASVRETAKVAGTEAVEATSKAAARQPIRYGEAAVSATDDALETISKGAGTIDDAYQLGLTSTEARKMGIQLTDEMADGLDAAARATSRTKQAATRPMGPYAPGEETLARATTPLSATDKASLGLMRRVGPAAVQSLKTAGKGALEVLGSGWDMALGRFGGTMKTFPTVYKGQIVWLPATYGTAGYKIYKASQTPGGLAEYFYPEKGPMETEEEWKDREAVAEYIQDPGGGFTDAIDPVTGLPEWRPGEGIENIMEWRTDQDLWELAGKNEEAFRDLKNQQNQAMRGELGNVLVISSPAEFEFYRQDLQRLGIDQSGRKKEEPDREEPSRKEPSREEPAKEDDIFIPRVYKRDDDGRKTYKDAPPIWEELYESSELNDNYYNTLFEEIKHIWTEETGE